MRSISRSRRKARIWSAGSPGPHDHFALNAGVPHPLGQRLKMLHFGTGGGGIVVITDTRGLRCGHYQRVIGVKEDEIGAKLDGLRKSEGEGLFIGGNLGGEEDGGGFAPTWLDDGGHGNLLVVRQYFRRLGIGLRCRAAHVEVIQLTSQGRITGSALPQTGSCLFRRCIQSDRCLKLDEIPIAEAYPSDKDRNRRSDKIM